MRKELLKSLLIPGWGLWDLGKRNEALIILLGAIITLPTLAVSGIVW
jgi:hypothetical protein